MEREVDYEGEPLESRSPEREQMDKEKDDEEEKEEEEDEGELALWSPNVQVLKLEKGERGLGFSILDYQVGNYLISFFFFFFPPSFFNLFHIFIFLFSKKNNGEKALPFKWNWLQSNKK